MLTEFEVLAFLACFWIVVLVAGLISMIRNKLAKRRARNQKVP